jgi:hypothetical protein
MFTGFFGRLRGSPDGMRFARAGATLRDVVVRNPPGMPYPVSRDERYVTFALTSADARPLKRCGRAILSLVSTSFNTGFRLGLDKPLREFHGAGAAERGRLPVLVARVGATVRCAAIDGMAYTLYDWEMRPIGRGTVRNGELRIAPDQPIFFVELVRR